VVPFEAPVIFERSMSAEEERLVMELPLRDVLLDLLTEMHLVSTEALFVAERHQGQTAITRATVAELHGIDATLQRLICRLFH
jgi:hypothetical protein